MAGSWGVQEEEEEEEEGDIKIPEGDRKYYFFFLSFCHPLGSSTCLDLLLSPSPGEPGERKERGDVTLGSERPSVQAR